MNRVSVHFHRKNIPTNRQKTNVQGIGHVYLNREETFYDPWLIVLYLYTGLVTMSKCAPLGNGSI